MIDIFIQSEDRAFPRHSVSRQELMISFRTLSKIFKYVRLLSITKEENDDGIVMDSLFTLTCPDYIIYNYFEIEII